MNHEITINKHEITHSNYFFLLQYQIYLMKNLILCVIRHKGGQKKFQMKGNDQNVLRQHNSCVEIKTKYLKDSASDIQTNRSSMWRENMRAKNNHSTYIKCKQIVSKDETFLA